ncbi:hypothetical protein JCM8547_008409 [Rhodosporidiobolus lusitaniae]
MFILAAGMWMGRSRGIKARDAGRDDYMLEGKTMEELNQMGQKNPSSPLIRSSTRTSPIAPRAHDDQDRRKRRAVTLTGPLRVAGPRLFRRAPLSTQAVSTSQ